MASESPTIALLANPASGDGGAGRVEELLRGNGARLRTFAPEQAEEAAASGAQRLVVAGGDGSVAPAASAAGKAGIPVAVIPTGTANDFAAAVGLPDGLEDTTLLALRSERRRAMDLAWLGERPFVNVASAGLPPRAARRASGLKGALGSAAYLVGAVQAAATARPVTCAVECDRRTLFRGEAWQVTVGCSGAFGAGASVGGSPGDGTLRAVAVPGGPRAALLWRAYGLRCGAIAAQRGVAAASCRSAHLDLPAGSELNVDGEVVESGPVSLRVQRAAFELVVG